MSNLIHILVVYKTNNMQQLFRTLQDNLECWGPRQWFLNNTILPILFYTIYLQYADMDYSIWTIVIIFNANLYFKWNASGSIYTEAGLYELLQEIQHLHTNFIWIGRAIKIYDRKAIG